MSLPKQQFPRVRACLFDMDGLLIDSEDMYTLCTNTILHEHGRPSLPWSIKAQLQGRPGPEAGRIFHQWAQLPISHEEFMAKTSDLQAVHFPKTKPLPGVERLIQRLVELNEEGKMHIALATSSHSKNYDYKTTNLRHLFDLFPNKQVVLGDDERIPKGRGKPLPDIYLLALKTINDNIRKIDGQEEIIRPEECLVFEDSVPGVEAGRRAGMQVLWCPHEGLLNEYKGREKGVLAGRTGEHKEEVMESQADVKGLLPGSPGKVGEIDDGWATLVTTLEDFPWDKYGISPPEQRPKKSQI